MQLIKKNLGKVCVTVNGLHNIDIEYEKLSIVKFIDNKNKVSSYVSKCNVPKGITIDDENYWQLLTTSNVDYSDPELYKRIQQNLISNQTLTDIDWTRDVVIQMATLSDNDLAPAFYKITSDNFDNIVGTMTIHMDKDKSLMYQILTTSYQLTENGKLDTELEIPNGAFQYQRTFPINNNGYIFRNADELNRFFKWSKWEPLNNQSDIDNISIEYINNLN